MITNSQQSKCSRRIPTFAVLAACALLSTACSSGDDDTQGSRPASTPGSVENEPDDTTGTTGDVPLELGRGVTDDTITIGYVYLDLDAVRQKGLINLNWGPQGDHVQAIADHINANGGINGRSIKVVPLAFDPADASSAQAACLQLTEDNEVFAVLGALRGDEVLCYTEQHDTIAVANTDMTQERLDRSIAPYASVNAARERIINSFVPAAASAGLFDDRTVAVLSVDAVDVAADIAIPALNDAGVSVEFESLIQGDGSVGGAAAELSVNVESMRARGIDTVVVVGDATIAVNTFIGEGFLPRLFFTDQGVATAVASRADLASFDGVYTYGGPTPSERFADPQFQVDCAAPWDALNPDAATQDPSAVPAGEPNNTIGLLTACRALAVFAAAADAAGPILNNMTFAAALDGIGKFTLPGTKAASLSAGKYDAEDDLGLLTYNPNAADDEHDFIEYTG